MLKHLMSNKSLQKYSKTFRNQQYQQWKWHNYTQWADLSFRPLLIISILFIIIKLSTIANRLEIYFSLGVQFILHLISFLLIPKLIRSQTVFLQVIPLMLQLCICELCYIVNEKGYEIFFVTVCTIFQSMYSTLIVKILAITIFVLQTIFLYQPESLEGMYLSTTLLLMQILRKEFQQLQHFLNLEALFLIIDSTPQAMCIVHKNKNWLLYSNKVFDNLAYKLESTNQSETDQSPEKGTPKNTTRNQLTFLQNLQLDEFNNDQRLVLFDFDDDDFQQEDQYKIKNVTYTKEKTQNLSQKSFFEIQTPPKNYQQQQKFFQSFKFNENDSVIKKTFTSDVTMKIEFNNSPQLYIQSAGKKSCRKKSFGQQKNVKSQNIITPSRKISADLLLSRESNRGSGQKQSLLDQDYNPSTKSKPTINHKMKFLINVLENCHIFDNDDELQIYFIHEVNQILLRKKLKKLESLKKNILRSISHELLTNLNAVFGYIKQCQDQLLKQESCHIQLAQALRYTKLQQYKIYDFFDYRDILEDSLKMKQDRFDINTVIRECVDLFKDQIQRRGLEIKVNLPEISYIIFGDRQRLCQVLLNLIGNAIRFTYSGEIRIVVKKQEYVDSMQGIDINYESFKDLENNLLEVQVTDTGIGMSEEELCILRKKLHLSDEDEKVSKQSVGIGLGLSVSKQIVKFLGPKNQNFLSVESQKEQMTTFSFFLQYHEEQELQQNYMLKSSNLQVPLDAQSTQQVKVMNYNKSSNLQITDLKGQSQMQIEINFHPCICKIALIVDDEQFNIDILSHYVKQFGFEIQTALNGKQAIDKVLSKLKYRCNQQTCIGFNCILMDINMPIMSGWEAVQRIRQIENEMHLPRTIPVIAVTAFCSIQDQKKSINEGFNSILIKPATKEDLLDTFVRLNI